MKKIVSLLGIIVVLFLPFSCDKSAELTDNSPAQKETTESNNLTPEQEELYRAFEDQFKNKRSGTCIAFKAYNGKFVAAEIGGDKKLIANRDWRRQWETFEFISLGGHKFALRAYNGKYVAAELGGDNKLIANRDWIREWETFEYVLLAGNKMAIRAYNGKYVAAELGGDKKLIANRNWIREWETFEYFIVPCY